MPSQRNLYHAKFDQCRARAELARDPKIAAIWMTIATSWQHLMDHEDRLSEEPPKYPL